MNVSGGNGAAWQNPPSFAHDDAAADGSKGNDDNALVLSLYLIDSEDDILPDRAAKPNGGSEPQSSRVDQEDVERRARLYRRLSRACALANDILRSSSSSSSPELDEHGNERSEERPASRDGTNNGHHLPWSSGGDGPIFGVHCDTSSDEHFINVADDVDGDDIWQSQSPSNHPSSSKDNSGDGAIRDALCQKRKNTGVGGHDKFRQPHLRAVCRYGNDVNDMWRCVSLALRLSATLSNTTSSPSSSKSPSRSHGDDRGDSLSCAIECWDANDGHILLIEAAEHLPNWADDDVLQGGAGGPRGCRNRCWIVDGVVRLIPPSMDNVDGSSSRNSSHDAPSGSANGLLGRRDALRRLMECTRNNAEDSTSSLAAPEAVQRAICDRIDRTDYSVRSGNISQGETNKNDRGDDEINSHWHVAAVAVPASVARFIKIHPCLVPLLVDSFCERAPVYLKECHVDVKDGDAPAEDIAKRDGDTTQNDTSKKMNRQAGSTTNTPLGTTFPYEHIVVLPMTLTRATYAELATGRGVVPSFPVPEAYRSVELNRLRRRLQQSHGNDDDDLCNNGMRRRKNPFRRAVDVGARLCAGLDWIISTNNAMKDPASKSLEDSVLGTMGDIERRLRIHWTRIDAEAARGWYNERFSDDMSSLPWIERAWRAGPNGSYNGTQGAECNKSLLRAMESMSKCPVFDPELSKLIRMEPCPFTCQGVSLLEMAKSGMRRALTWQRDDNDEDLSSFPVPRAWEVDDDAWMEVNSLGELEEEMKSLSSSRKLENRDSNVNAEGGKKPRRQTTRRSRRKLARVNCDVNNVEEESNGDDGDGDDGPKEKDAQSNSLNKVLTGFRSFIEGEGELEGAITKNDDRTRPLPPEHNGESGNNQRSITTKKADLDEPEQLMSREVDVNPRKFLNLLHAMLRQDHSTEESKSNLVANSDQTASTVDEMKGFSHTAIDDRNDVSKFFFEEDFDDVDDDASDGSLDGSDNGDIFHNEGPNSSQFQVGQGGDPWSLQNIMEAMDHELRTDADSDPSIKSLSVVASSENNDAHVGGERDTDGDVAILTNLLSSIDAQGDGGSGPVTNILREMGICPPRLPTDEDDIINVR
eukprot:CAMPEP_0181136178 /NCGR_PEP_ID=MMETSP1071-20121207/33045_1 /TAXON_ID=35127 /ORGANISM="Thalassiosira sp., Strain NH16" /LENGTH=1094 /DNA_ID=CAMNT_0023222871 /DNA_START=157 /DNA_END=3438 /DNA_ORIENTATION=+